VVCEERCDGPCRTQDRDDKEDEDVVGGESVCFGVDVHEVGKHAEGWDQCDDLHEAPKGEEDSENHVCRVLAVCDNGRWGIADHDAIECAGEDVDSSVTRLLSNEVSIDDSG